jgi:hypothetical protein
MIYKIKNPVEYSFHIWMSNHPDSAHWADKARFYLFVKTVCRYNARKWKNRSYLKKRILNRMPHFDLNYLDNLLDLYMQLIEFHNTAPLRASGLAKGKSSAKSNCYIERQVKDGQIIEKVLPLDL